MSRRPAKAEQIADALALRIARGEFAPRTWLPTLRDLSEEYRADPRTVSSALTLLAARDVVEQSPGQGARVTGRTVQRDAVDITRQVGQWRGFHVAATRAGAQAYTDTYLIADVPAPPEVADRLGIPAGTNLLQRARVQGLVTADTREPVQLSTTWIAPDVVERLPILREHNTGPGGMGSRLEEAGYILEYEDTVTARTPSSEDQERLGLGSDQPALVVWRRAFDQHSHRAIEVTVRIINPALHKLVYRYT